MLDCVQCASIVVSNCSCLLHVRVNRLAVDVGTSSSAATTVTGGKKSNGTTARQYAGTVDCLRSTYQQEGIRGVYAGFGVSLAGTSTVLYCMRAHFCTVHCVLCCSTIHVLPVFTWAKSA